MDKDLLGRYLVSRRRLLQGAALGSGAALAGLGGRAAFAAPPATPLSFIGWQFQPADRRSQRQHLQVAV